jgi:uncharacterized protein
MGLQKSSMVSLLLIFPLGYLVILGVLYFRQDQMIFLPEREDEAELDRLAEAQGFVPWRLEDGRRIGWMSDFGEAENSGHALHRAWYRDFLRAQGSRRRVYVLDYPGYGARPGRPSEASTTAAALEAFDTLDRPGVSVMVLGESLGSGVASAIVGARPDRVAGLVLVTPFDSLTGAAQSHYPWLPISSMLRTRFDSVTNLRAYPGPVGFVVGALDRTVPAPLGLRLHENYPGRKHLWLVPDAGHDVSDFLGTRWGEIEAFLDGGR